MHLPSWFLKKRKLFVAVFGVIALLLAAGAVYINLNPSNETVTDKVRQLMELPISETPSVITVSNKEKLAGQLFFLNAENGDKVLIFPKSGKSILYRPSSNKIIEVAVVNSDKWSPLPVASGYPSQ